MRCTILFSRDSGGNEKASSLSMPKSKEADNQDFLFFYNFFKFIKDFDFTLMYCNL